MDEGVEGGEEDAVAARGDFDGEPKRQRHREMMKHVQKGDVRLFFAQNEEEGVDEFDDFDEEDDLDDDLDL